MQSSIHRSDLGVDGCSPESANQVVPNPNILVRPEPQHNFTLLRKWRPPSPFRAIPVGLRVYLAHAAEDLRILVERKTFDDTLHPFAARSAGSDLGDK
jgi:hypothetical protein